MKPDSISISIDTLRIEGFSNLDSKRVRDSFESHLHKLASSNEQLNNEKDRNVGHILLPKISITDHTSPQKIGRELASQLWRMISHE